TFTGLDYGGSSAATGWPVWDDESGTTTTELCSATCPSGATPPPPVAGSYTLHVKTTSDFGGVYQAFPLTSLSTASMYLNVVSGTVAAELLGPSSGTGWLATPGSYPGVFLNPNGGAYNEIILYSWGAPAEFYVDAVAVAP
ncbi:MAG: hypothetical protein ACLPY1_21975, partial [Terracidiphilus sp.]